MESNRAQGVGIEELQHFNQKTSALSRVTKARLVNGNMRDAVRKPNKSSVEDWIASNLVDFFNSLLRIYSYCAHDSRRFRKPGEGFPPRFEYRWPGEKGKTIQCSASDYVKRVFLWIREELEHGGLVPSETKATYSEDFDLFAHKAYTRLFRVFAIIYHSHFEVIEARHAATELNSDFKHFFFFTLEHCLVDTKEYIALSQLCDRLEEMYYMHDQNADSEPEETPQSPQPLLRTSSSAQAGGRRTEVQSPVRNLSKASAKSQPPISLGRESSKSAASSTSGSSFSHISGASTRPSTPRGSKGRMRQEHQFARVIKRRSAYLDSMETLVKRSDVFEKLGVIKEETSTFGKTCVDSVEEILHSEMEFGDLVWTVHDEFMLTARSLDVSPRSISRCFVNIGEILRFSELLNVEMHLNLVDRMSNASQYNVPTLVKIVSTSITPQLSSLRIFAKFLATYDSAVEELETMLNKSTAFGNIIAKKKDSLGRNLLGMLEEIRIRPQKFLSQLENLQFSFETFLSSQAANGEPVKDPSGNFVTVAHEQWGANVSGRKQSLERSSSILGSSIQSAQKALKLAISTFREQLGILQTRTAEVYLQYSVFETVFRKEKEEFSLQDQLMGSGAIEYRINGIDAWTQAEAVIFQKVLAVVESSDLPDTAESFTAPTTSKSIFSRLSATVSNFASAPRKSRVSKQRITMRGVSRSSTVSATSESSEKSSTSSSSKRSKIPTKDKFFAENCSITTEQLRHARYRASEGRYSIRMTHAKKGTQTASVIHFRTKSAEVAACLFQFAQCTAPPRLFSHLASFEDLTGPRESKRGSKISLPRAGFSSSVPLYSKKGDNDQYDFFLSYHSSVALDQALSLYLDLKNQGFRVWLDKTVESDTPNTQLMQDGIKRSKVFLLLMKSGALLRHWVQAEIRVAQRLQKPIAVIFDGGLPSTMLSRKQPTSTPFETYRLGMGTLESYTKDRALIPADIALLFDEITAVPLQHLGTNRTTMWEMVLQQLHMTPPREKSVVPF